MKPTPDTKKMIYFLAVYPAEEGGFWTRFVDFPAADQGESVEDAILQSSTFLQDIVDCYAETVKKPLPVPTPIENFRAKLDPEDGEPLCIVPVTVYPPAKTQRINITGKANLFAKIDDYAKRHHLTRSDLMISSTLEYIQANP